MILWRGIIVALLIIASAAAAADTLASPAAARWDDYQIIMYARQTARRYQGLRALGITGGLVVGTRGEVDISKIREAIQPLLQADLPWYVENLATDFYSAYHYWTPEHPNDVNWRFSELKQRHRQNPSDASVLIREPSLSDPVWLARIVSRLRDNVRAFAPYRPLYYDLGDETGIADLAAAWDFDFSPVSLAAMREWLRGQYGSLAALNRQWGTSFAAWEQVMPPTTTAAMRETGENFSAWSDFKAWMDEAFARAVRAGAGAIHAADPNALAAMEGAQAPGWGGYDFSRLAHVVDLMELVDSGNNVEIVRSLNPQLKLLTTSFDSGAREQHRLWHELLLGGRGTIIWDDRGDFVGDDGSPGARAREAAPLYAELRSGIGAQMIAGASHADPVAVLYSPASFRIFWMLAQRARGDAWTARGSGTEAEDNGLRASMRRAASLLVHLGIGPRWITPDQLENGVLRTAGLRALVLPYAIAMSAAEAAEIRAFAARGGVVMADVEPGVFDQHGRRLDQSQLAELRDRDAIAPLPQTQQAMSSALASAGVVPSFRLTHEDGSPVTDVEARVFDDGGVTILGLQRDLAPGAEQVVLSFAEPRFMHDIRRGGDWVRLDKMLLTLDGVAPILLAVASAPLAPPTLSVAARVVAGESTDVRITSPDTIAAARALHIQVTDPSGNPAPRYSGNIVVRDGSAVWPLPFTASDPAGRWTVAVRDVLGGGGVSASVELSAP